MNIHVLLCGDAFTGPALPRGSYERLAQMLYPVQSAKLECTKKMTRGFYQYAVRHCLFAVTHRIRSGGEDRPYNYPSRLGPVCLSLLLIACVSSLLHSLSSLITHTSHVQRTPANGWGHPSSIRLSQLERRRKHLHRPSRLVHSKPCFLRRCGPVECCSQPGEVGDAEERLDG